MRNFLTNLLIAVSLCLCVLIWFQWVREGRTRHKLQALTDTVHDRDETIQGIRGTVKRYEAEISRLDGLKNQLTATVRSNRQEIVSLTGDLDKTKTDLERQTRQVEAYKDALDRANESINKQNEDVKRQNEEMKKMAEERNEIVAKYNKVVGDFNDLATKWNTLQESLSKTNAPADKK